MFIVPFESNGNSSGVALSTDAGQIQNVGTQALGNATTAAPANHVHAHGNQLGGTLHADATTGTSGFLSAADKTKLDGLIGPSIPGITIPFNTVYTTASRYVLSESVQYGSASSGTATIGDAYHMFLPASSIWRLDMITNYSYGGGGTLSASVLTTTGSWLGAHTTAASVSTTSGGIGTVYTTTYTVGASPEWATFNCRHSSSGINSVIMRFYRIG